MIDYSMDEASYHSRPELSSTGARRILESPAKFKWEQDHPSKPTPAMVLGTAVHTKVLGTGAKVVTYPDEYLTPLGNVSTGKAAKAWEAEQVAAGHVILTRSDAARVDAMAESVLAHPKARALFEFAAHREVSVIADVDGVPCRARFDALSGETSRGVWALDLKTTEDASPKAFERATDKHGYHVQAAHYEAVYEASEGHPIDAFLFVVVEKNGPYGVGIYQLSHLWRQMGQTAAREARRLYAECVEKNEWPGLPEDVQLLEPPAWAVVEHEMRYAS